MIATTVNLTTVQENALLVQGALIEIYGFFVLVVYIFTGSCGILIPVLYFQFLRFKYVFSDTCKAAFAQGTLIKTHMCVHVCYLCVCEREREIERERKKERERVCASCGHCIMSSPLNLLVRAVHSTVRQTTDGVFHGRFMPGLIGSAYDKLVAQLSYMGDLKAQQQQRQQDQANGSASSWCNVM